MKSFRNSLFALFVFLISTQLVMAGLPEPVTISTPTTPELTAAQNFAKQFLDTAFAGDFSNAEKMMTPDPPYKGNRSSAEFRKSRQADIKRVVDDRNKIGKTRTWDAVSNAKWESREGRPPEEQFASFYFNCTYPNGAKSGNRVVVMKKADQMYIELFTY